MKHFEFIKGNIEILKKNEESFYSCKKYYPILKESDLSAHLALFKHMYQQTVLAYPGDFVFYDAVCEFLAKGFTIHTSLLEAIKHLDRAIKIEFVNFSVTSKNGGWIL